MEMKQKRNRKEIEGKYKGSRREMEGGGNRGEMGEKQKRCRKEIEEKSEEKVEREDERK